MRPKPGGRGGEPGGLRDRGGDDELAIRIPHERVGERHERVGGVDVEDGDEDRVRRTPERGRLRSPRSSDASCRRIACSSSWSAAPGSRPSWSTSRLARRPVHLEGLGLPVAPVESEHPQRVEPLPERVIRGERLELPHQLGLSTAGEVRLDPTLERDEAKLVEPRGRRTQHVASATSASASSLQSASAS